MRNIQLRQIFFIHTETGSQSSNYVFILSSDLKRDSEKKMHHEFSIERLPTENSKN